MLVGSLTYFDLVFVLTGGGPGDATRVLSLDMYLTGFSANDMGAASVLAVDPRGRGLLLSLGLARLSGFSQMAANSRGHDDHRSTATQPPRTAPRRDAAAAPAEPAAARHRTSWALWRLALARRHHRADLLHRHHQPAQPGRLLQRKPACAVPTHPTLDNYQWCCENDFFGTSSTASSSRSPPW